MDEPTQEKLTDAMEEAASREVLVQREEMMAMIANISPEGSTASKFTPEHITQYLEIERLDMEKRYEDERDKRKAKKTSHIINAILSAFGIAIAAFLLVVFRDSPNEVSDIIEKIIVGVISALGGYGLGKSRRKDDDD